MKIKWRIIKDFAINEISNSCIISNKSTFRTDNFIYLTDSRGKTFWMMFFLGIDLAYGSQILEGTNVG